MMKYHSRSIRSQLIWIFLLLLLPVMILGVLIFHSSNRSMEDAVERTAGSSVSFLMDNLESQIESIDTQLNQLTYESDTEFKRFAFEAAEYSNSQYWLELRGVMNKLRVARESNVLTDAVTIYYPKLDLFLSSKTGAYPIERERFRDELFSFDRQENRGVVSSSEGWMFVGRKYPINASAEQEPLLFLQARISEQQLRDYFASMLSASQYPTAFLDNESERVIVSMYDAPEDYSLLEQILAGREWQGSRVVSVHSAQLNCTLVQLVPLDELFHESRRLTNWLVLYMLSCIPIVCIYSLLIRRVVRRPIDRMLEAFGDVQQGRLSVHLEERAHSKEFDRLFRHFNSMVQKLNDLIDRAYRQELFAKQMELKQLQAQIDPHFLYNSHFILKHLIQNEDTDSAAELASYLGEYFQYVTRNGAGETALADEYRHTCVYLEIQSIRFGARMSKQLADLPEACAAMLVPRLILQPIVENSLKYGIHRGGTLRIVFEQKPDMLIICVEDSGEELTAETVERLTQQLDHAHDQQETTALINIHRRLILRYGEGAGLYISRSAMGGLCVQIRIPMIPKEEKTC